MKEIQLRGKYNDKVVLVDDEDFEYLNQFKWYYVGRGYAFRHYRIKGTNNRYVSILMHREILNPPSGTYTDHINHNKLDNRRCNLRICTNSQNMANIPLNYRRNTSGYRGVHWNKPLNKWRAAITYNGKRYHIGYYDNIEDASIAYNKKAKELFGDFAYIK